MLWGRRRGIWLRSDGTCVAGRSARITWREGGCGLRARAVLFQSRAASECRAPGVLCDRELSFRFLDALLAQRLGGCSMKTGIWLRWEGALQAGVAASLERSA